MMSLFNTGDTPATDAGVLRMSSDYLQRGGYEFKRALGDAVGVYAHELRGPIGTLYLVARRAKPYHQGDNEYVSTQRWLINHAAEQNAPLLVSLWPRRDKPRLRLFDPQELKRFYAEQLLDTHNDNTRIGVRMLNYEWSLGVDVTPQHIAKEWSRLQDLKLQRSRVRDRPLIETYLVQEPEPGEHHCTECGATYYSRDTCPGCGHKEATA